MMQPQALVGSSIFDGNSLVPTTRGLRNLEDESRLESPIEDILADILAGSVFVDPCLSSCAVQELGAGIYSDPQLCLVIGDTLIELLDAAAGFRARACCGRSTGLMIPLAGRCQA